MTQKTDDQMRVDDDQMSHPAGVGPWQDPKRLSWSGGKDSGAPSRIHTKNQALGRSGGPGNCAQAGGLQVSLAALLSFQICSETYPAPVQHPGSASLLCVALS